MPFEQYWIGKDIDLEQLWRDFEEGAPIYIEKYKSMRVHLVRLSFNNYPAVFPLFNHEAIYKTIKAIFHDFKREAFTESEYGALGPIFLYKIDRNSEEWLFLAEPEPLIGLVFLFLVPKIQEIIKRHREIKKLGRESEAMDLANLEKALSIINTKIDGVSRLDLYKVVTAVASPKISKAIAKLLGQGFKNIEISKKPFEGNLKETQKEMIGLNDVLDDFDKTDR